MNETQTVEQGFYQRCAELLNCAEHTYRPRPYRKRTRWTRGAGNGRYPGFGIIRLYGDDLVHMSLRAPIAINRWLSKSEALDILTANVYK